MTSRNASKTGNAAAIVVKLQKGATLKVMPAPMSKVNLSVFKSLIHKYIECPK
jgi:hypothetical protein